MCQQLVETAGRRTWMFRLADDGGLSLAVTLDRPLRELAAEVLLAAGGS